MRAFSTILVAITLALSANAASIEKRAISTNVQTCINDINATSDQLVIVSTAVNAFKGSILDALAIHTKEQTLETALKKAGTSCCAADPATVNSDEASAVLSVVSALVPKVTDALSAIQAKKTLFATAGATAIVQSDIKNLNTQTTALDTCLLAKTPAANLAEANGYVAQINAGFAAARAAYGI